MDKKRLIVIIVFAFLFIIAIALSMLNYKGKYSVSFETGTKDVFLTKYVEKNDKINIPTNPEKEGYIFEEWQLNGKKYDFDSEITSNIVLTAKWIKEEYIVVNFKSEDENIDSKKILKGKSVGVLPIISKENYNFIGWFLNDKLYNNEEIYDDVTLIAKFERNVNYKVGDKIKIVGNYSESAYSNHALHSAAIGWEREILYVITDSEFPYAVGNKNGVTGFFKRESIELK